MSLELAVGVKVVLRNGEIDEVVRRSEYDDDAYPWIMKSDRSLTEEGLYYSTSEESDYDAISVVSVTEHTYDADLSSLGEGISTPEQQLEQLLKIMPADVIVMEAFKVLVQRSRAHMETYDELSGRVVFTLEANFNLNHGDASIDWGIGSYSRALTGQSFNAILDKYIDDELFKKAQSPLCLPRA